MYSLSVDEYIIESFDSVCTEKLAPMKLITLPFFHLSLFLKFLLLTTESRFNACNFSVFINTNANVNNWKLHDFYFSNNYSDYISGISEDNFIFFSLIVIHMFYMHYRLLTNSLVEMTLQSLNKFAWFNNFKTDKILLNCYLILSIIMQYIFQRWFT